MNEFHYQEPFPLGPDTTGYEQISSDYVSTEKVGDREILKVDPQALTFLANEAIKAVSFRLRTSHLKQVASILDDPEASENDRMVALMLLKNAEIASHGILPGCQDTGTAIVMGKKGEGRRRRSPLGWHSQNLSGGKPALLTSLAQDDVRGGQHQDKPPRPD